jgi:hypothetical protein
MLIQNLTTNTLVLRFEQSLEGEVTSATGWNFFLTPGMSFEAGQFWNPAPYETWVGFKFVGDDDSESGESLTAGTLLISDTGDFAQGYHIPVPVANGQEGVYLAARYQLVASFMLLGFVAFLCYQSGRKSSQK